MNIFSCGANVCSLKSFEKGKFIPGGKISNQKWSYVLSMGIDARPILRTELNHKAKRELTINGDK